MENIDNKINQLDLFQKLDDYKDVFEKAQISKENIQKKYTEISIKEFSSSDIDKFCIFDFDITVTQLSEQPEPNSPKLFIRKYVPTLKIINEEPNPEIINFTEKVVPKWINEIYVGNSISQDYFHEIAKQYLLLETIDNFIKNNEYSQYINGKIGIIHMNGKLLGRAKSAQTNPYITATINNINNIFNRLVSQSNFILIGSYLNYIFENTLILQLDESTEFNNQDKISNFFQNDFLLLNNMEFMMEKPYTLGWPSPLYPPFILDMDNKKIDMSKISKFFFFQKIKDDGVFYKTEVYMPNNLLNEKLLENVISISTEFLKQNKTQKQ